MPDFLIIGGMKAATTTLFRWLETHPQVVMPSIKEPNFFTAEDRWRRGTEWYTSLFSANPLMRTGEATVRYTDPDLAPTAASRIKRVAPHARLVFIHRDPVARAQSHYRHEVRHGRERKLFADALKPNSPYVQYSCAYRALLPYFKLLENNLLIVEFSDLTGPSTVAWERVLAHLSLSPYDRPTSWNNETRSMPQYGNVMRLMVDSGISEHFKRVPRPVRRIVRPILVRSDDSKRAVRLHHNASARRDWVYMG